MTSHKPEPGKRYYSPVNAVGAKFPDINVLDLGVSISSHPVGEQREVWPVLGVLHTDGDHGWDQLYMKMEWFVTSLSIGTFTYCWLSDRIYDETWKEVWRKPGTLKLITEKEGDPLILEDTPKNLMPLMVNLTYWVSISYPRVFLYHYIGLLLLRTPLVGYDLNSEILLNFFKIAELVTATRFFKIAELVTATRMSRKPRLKLIIATSKALNAPYDESEVKEFWKVRSRDAAHDDRKAQHIERELAVDCKMWAEYLVIQDWRDRGEKILRKRQSTANEQGERLSVNPGLLAL